jgi:RHS repeat-associated protein
MTDGDDLSRREFLRLSGALAAAGLGLAGPAGEGLAEAQALAGAGPGGRLQGAGDVLSLPRGGGAVRGIGETFRTDPFTGTATVSVPIATSPGRGGFGPQLPLTYGSGHGNGPFGLGWALSVPRVSRKTEKGLPRYAGDDTFVLSGAEDLVEHAGRPPRRAGEYRVTSYRPRVEGLFARIERWERIAGGTAAGLSDVFWRVTSVDNVTSYYGRTPQATLANPEVPAQVFEWYLELSCEPRGNYIRYEYKAEDGEGVPAEIFEGRRRHHQRYVKRIRYGNLAPFAADAPGAVERLITRPATDDEHLFLVVFDYGEHGDRDPQGGHEVVTVDLHREVKPWTARPDPVSSYRAGFEIRTHRRCRRVLMFHTRIPGEPGPVLVKSTDFRYAQNADTLGSFLTGVTLRGYQRATGPGDFHSEEVSLGEPGVRSAVYRIRSLPPLEFRYSEFRPTMQRYRVLEAVAGDLPARGPADPTVALVDLFGTGLPDLLQTTPSGWYAWRNLGAGRLDRRQPLRHQPAGVTLDQSGVGFGDMTGDGQADVLVHRGPLWGFYEATHDGGWKPFRPYRAFPSFRPDDRNVRMLDVTGDGRADALVTGGHHFTYFPCLGEEGFGPPESVERISDLDRFPDVDFDDPSRRVRLADMTGDGLQDIVLVHADRIDYWPNQGYGRFGARITMRGAPALGWELDPDRVFLADLDGDGCADLAYVESGRVRFWFNQSGNGWSREHVVRGTPPVTDASAVELADVLGQGSAGILWSRTDGAPGLGEYAFLDLSGGTKPYLLTEITNNMGATTRVAYSTSTWDQLEDLGDGRPWATPLPAPVHVVRTVETIDHVSQTKLVTSYRYHHGYYDGRDREFRGFGRVDRRDTEAFERFSAAGLHPIEDPFTNAAPDHHVPPALTKTWFHTGAVEGERRWLERIRAEWYGGDPEAFPLAEQAVETGDTPHDAYRALRGAVLRSEVYTLDGGPREGHPHVVTQSTHVVTRLQPRDGRPYPVYLARLRDTLTYHYERRPDDPRVSQRLVLAFDAFGNPTDTVAIAYPRRAPEFDEQAAPAIVYDRADFINADTGPGAYRVGVPYQLRRYEIVGVPWRWTAQPVPLSPGAFADVTADPGAFQPFAWRAPAGLAAPAKRLVAWQRRYFRRDAGAEQLDAPDDLTHRLPLGQIDSLGLPYETRQAAFADGFVEEVFGGRVTEPMLRAAGYARETDRDAAGHWWLRSGHQAFDPAAFWVPRRTRDPFGQVLRVEHDAYALLLRSAIDPVGNRIHVENDYRVLQPFRRTDANGNRVDVAFDALGLVVGTAVMGKAGERRGDSLDGFEATLEEAPVTAYLRAPLGAPATLLGRASSRFVYDLWRYRRTGTLPVVIATLLRETHDAELAPGESPRVQHRLGYCDGLGREIQRKVPAEPGPVPRRDPATGRFVVREGRPAPTAGDVSPRWIGSGWTIFNNKGKPVREYEPFFTDTHEFEFDPRIGVGPLRFYDPLDRVIGTLYPDHTWDKGVFGPWRHETWDGNDTAAIADPRSDPDLGPLFARLRAADYLPTWHARRQGLAPGAPERAAAAKAAAHAATPTVAHLDALGRRFLTVAHNRSPGDDPSGPPAVEAFPRVRVVYDLEGHQREVIDPRGRTVMRCAYDMVGRRFHQASMEAGERWLLPDVSGQPVHAWDGRGHHVVTEYDALRRPLRRSVQGTDPVHSDPRTLGGGIVVDRIEYGEGVPDDVARNLRTRVVRRHDGAGIVTTGAYDFKGNLLGTSRQLARDYRALPDWSGPVPLEPEIYRSAVTYDALDRPTTLLTPDGSVLRSGYDGASRLQRIDVNLRGEQSSGAPVWTPVVTDIRYDARGQRTRIEHGNGTRTEYEYDPDTFRLVHLRTSRDPGAFPDDCPGPPAGAGTGCAIQSLRYTYDPVGNVVACRDDAQQTVFFRNRRVEPSADYAYDALYRLVEATGREHLGQVGGPPSVDEGPRVGLLHPGDGNALARYRERYAYDEAGNLVAVTHRGDDPSRPGWTRAYTYDEASLVEPAARSNRLTRTTVAAAGPQPHLEECAHDPHGNMVRLPPLQAMAWDFADHLVMTRRQATGAADGLGTSLPAERTHYVYDASGQRVRKVTELPTGEIKDERIYVGSYEAYRRRGANGLVRETIHVMDGPRRVALVETRTGGGPGEPARLVRYQVGNHVGSATLELDDQARIVSYEEYYPYGSTSYQATRSRTEAAKRYRYTGRERDEETGLYYHGARYYAPWLGRWISCDPAGLPGGINAFVYANDSPVQFTDPSGLAPALPEIPQAGQPVGSLAEGLQVLDQLADLVNAIGAEEEFASAEGQAEFFLGRRGGQYRVFRLEGELGGQFPPGHEPIAHTHPQGAMVTFEDLNTTRQQAPAVGGVRTHLVARGGNRWSILEVPAEGAATLTELDLRTGTVQTVFELEAPGVTSERLTPHIAETARRLDQPAAVRNLGELAEALEGRTPVGTRLLEPAGSAGRAASALSTTESAAGEVKAAGQVTATDKIWAYGLRGLKLLGRLLTVYGAANEADRSYAAAAPGLFNPSANYVATFVGAVVAGAVDDAMMAVNPPAGVPLVIESWERHGAGPTQVLWGNVVRAVDDAAPPSWWPLTLLD